MAITKATASSIAPAAKGDLVVGSATNDAAILGVGTNGYLLTADSAEATGMKWAAAAGGGMTLIETITLSGASVTSSTIAGTYKDLRLIVRNYRPDTNGANLQVRINGETGSKYSSTQTGAQLYDSAAFSETAWYIALQQNSTTATGLSDVLIPDYANTATRKTAMANGITNFETNPTTRISFFTYKYAFDSTSAITSLTFAAQSGNLTSGSVLIYGVN